MAQDWRGKGGYDLDSEKEDDLEIVEEGYGKYRRPDAEDPEETKERLRLAGSRLRVTIFLLVIVIGGIVYMISRPERDLRMEGLMGIRSLSEASILYAALDTAAVGIIRGRFGETGDLLPFVDGAVVNTLFAQHPVEIWVGVATLGESAGEAISLLLEATDPDIAPVWEEQTQEVRGTVPITRLSGRGQIIYFYRTGRMVVWIGGAPAAAPVALDAALASDIEAWLRTVRETAAF